MTTELLKNVTLQCVTRIPKWPCNFFSNIQVIPWFTQIGGLIMVHWTPLAFNFWKMERQVLEALIHFIGPWLLVDSTLKIAQMGTTQLFVKGLQIWICKRENKMQDNFEKNPDVPCNLYGSFQLIWFIIITYFQRK